MAKNNNTLLIVALLVGAFFVFHNPTGNYASDYQSYYDLSATSCPQEGKMDCHYDPQRGVWTSRTCHGGVWAISQMCDTLLASGDRSCIYKTPYYGHTITMCQSPRVPKTGSPDYFAYTSPQ